MKKVLSLVLAVVLVLGMSTVAFAYPAYNADDVQKSSNKYFKLALEINGTAQISGTKFVDNYKVDGDILVVPDVDDNTVKSTVMNKGTLSGKTLDPAGAESAELAVYVKKFATATDAAANYEPLAFTDVSRFDLEVKLSSSSAVIKGVKLVDNGGFAFVRFEMQNYLDSASTKAFADKVYLTADSKKMTGTDFEIKGKFKNDVQKVDNEDETEWALADSANRKLEVKANVRNAELELDYDVFLYTTLYNGRNVYARATNIANNTQFAVMDKYSAIEEVITLYTAGLTSTTKVFFDRPEKLYVYGVDTSKSYDAAADAVKLVYLGTTAEKLPLVDQYFLSVKELAIEVTPVEPEPSVPSESVSNPVGGGDTTAPNANYNPGTGC